MASFLHSPLSFPSPALLALLALLLASLAILRRRTPKLCLPPSPPSLPILGNWLHVGHNYLNHHLLSRLALKYGPIFLLKMGHRNVVVVSSPALAKDVLLTQGVEFGSRIRNIVFDIFSGGGQDMIFAIYGDHWRKMRRIVTTAFSTSKVLQHYIDHWHQEIDYAIADLKANPIADTFGVVIRHRLHLLMYNIMYRIMFNHRFESENDLLYLELKKLNIERIKLASSFVFQYGDFIPILRPFLRGHLQYCQKVKEQRIRFLRKHFVDEYRKLNSAKPPSSEKKCAMDHILEAQKNGEITEDNALYIIENINVAGLESTLAPMEWGLVELVNNPNIQRNIRDEIDKILGHGVPLTQSRIPELPYLNAFVKETFRLHMVVPLLVQHVNLKQAKLGGYDIPAESRVVVNAWYLANNPELWEKPEVFNPDRFLGCEKIDSIDNQFRFLPFGVGRRSCPGMVLAIPIVSLVLGRLVQTFELHPPPGESKLDVTGQGGQFSLRIANYSTIVCKPIEDAISNLVDHLED